MQIDSVNNNQQTFNGYLHKNVKKFINNEIKYECRKIVRDASRRNKELDPALLKEVKERGKRIIKKFEEYVAPMHKDTYIDFGRHSWIPCEEHFSLSNPISKKPIVIQKDSDIFKTEFVDFYHHTYYDDIMRPRLLLKPDPKGNPTTNLMLMEETVDALLKDTRAAQIDEKFLEYAEKDLEKYDETKFLDRFLDRFFDEASFIGGMILKIKAAMVENYGKSIGKNSSAKEIVSKRIKRVKGILLEAEQKRRAERELENRNNQILKDVLNS